MLHQALLSHSSLLWSTAVLRLLSLTIESDTSYATSSISLPQAHSYSSIGTPRLPSASSPYM